MWQLCIPAFTADAEGRTGVRLTAMHALASAITDHTWHPLIAIDIHRPSPFFMSSWLTRKHWQSADCNISRRRSYDQFHQVGPLTHFHFLFISLMVFLLIITGRQSVLINCTGPFFSCDPGRAVFHIPTPCLYLLCYKHRFVVLVPARRHSGTSSLSHIVLAPFVA